MIDAGDRVAVGAFLTRLLRLAPTAVVRLRPEPPRGATGTGVAGRIWAMLPFQVLVNQTLRVPPPTDATVGAADLLAALAETQPALAGDQAAPSEAEARALATLRRRDQEWRWPLPPATAEAVETIPAADVIRLAAAASRTVRTALAEGVGGRAVGERAVRDALLDHVAVVVTTEHGERIEVRQRLVQGIVRMGLVGRPSTPLTDTDGDGQVTVRRAMGWTGLCGVHGCAWYRPISPLRLS